MKIRGFKRVAVSLAASAAMVGGLALAAPATASAASDRYEGPELEVTQTDAEKNVTLKLTNPNKTEGLFAESSCTSTLLSGQQGMEALVAFDNKDFIELLKIIGKPGLHVGPSASNNLLKPGPNSDSKDVKVADGVYVYVGTCGGIKSLEPGNVGVSIKPVIVPSGFGSLAVGSAFGSLMLESGGAIMSVLPLLLKLGSVGGSGS